jgi:hypothetical protein
MPTNEGLYRVDTDWKTYIVVPVLLFLLSYCKTWLLTTFFGWLQHSFLMLLLDVEEQKRKRIWDVSCLWLTLQLSWIPGEIACVRDMRPLEIHNTLQWVYFKASEDGDEPELHSKIPLVPLSKHITSWLNQWLDGFSGLVVCILASGSRVRGFKPDRNRWIFLCIKILSMPSFGGEVK